MASNRALRSWPIVTAWLASATLVVAGSNFAPDHAHAWSSNLGWTDWRGDNEHGAAIGEYVCSGNLYGANVGWLSLGNGAPVNGRSYQNNSASDFGVNVDSEGNLRGYAYGANIGWVAFEAQGNPRLNLFSGTLSGHIYGANVGWISLSNTVAFLQIESLAPPQDTDTDGLPDSWELSYAPNLTVLGVDHDADLDGASDAEEYAADTHPILATDYFLVTRIVEASENEVTLTWTSKSTRLYRAQRRSSVSPDSPWTDAGMPLATPDPGPTTTRNFSRDSDQEEFYRIRVERMLAP
jgi:hypothetical protein